MKSLSLAICAIVYVSGSTYAIQPSIDWIRDADAQNSNDEGRGVAVDPSTANIYLTGYTQGNLGSPVNGFLRDIYLRGFNPSGSELWTTQFGTTSNDYSEAVATDQDGNIYVSGRTEGSLQGNNAGSFDAFVAKINSAGTINWIRQIGTSSFDGAEAVATDGQGNVYITGTTGGNLSGGLSGGSDAFLAKYDSSGDHQWTQQLGTSSLDGANAVAADNAGNIFIAGTTFGSLSGDNLGSVDGFIAKYDSSGAFQWAEQVGTVKSDAINGIAIDSLGGVFVTGRTRGNLNAINIGNKDDAFVARYSSSGVLNWITQIGTSGIDIARGIELDSADNAYIVGSTEGELAGKNAGISDVFLTKLDNFGVIQWIEQVGGSSVDTGYSIAVREQANVRVYVAGTTAGNVSSDTISGFNDGNSSAFLAKYTSFANVTLPGDYNEDGIVDAADYTKWRDNLGSPAGTLPNDTTETFISAAQYSLWQENYGALLLGQQIAIEQLGVIPEPSALALCSTFLPLLCRWRIRTIASVKH